MGPSSLVTSCEARWRSARASLLACCVALLCAGGASAQIPGPLGSLLQPAHSNPSAAAPAPPQPSPAPSASPSAIPLPDVAARSEDLKRVLRNLSNQLPAPDQLADAQATLDDRQDELTSRQKEVDALLAGTPNTLELREQENYWRSAQADTADLRRQLLNWANAAQSALQQVQAQEPIWQATLQQNEATPGLGPTLAVIQQALSELHQLGQQAQDQLKTIVNLQVRAATQDQLALDMLDRITEARASADRKLFQRDSLPIWRVRQRRQTGENSEYFGAASERMLGIRAFAAQSRGTLAFFFVLLVLSLFGAYRLHRATQNVQPQTARQAEVLRIIHHWVALGLLLPLLCAYVMAPLAPVPLIGLVILVSFIPILRLLPALIPPRFRILLYCLAGVYTVTASIAWIAFSPFYKRGIQFLIGLAVFLVFAYLLRPGRISRFDDSHHHRGWLFVIRAAVAVIGAALLANFFGYVKLAQFLSVFCLYSTFVAISMLTGVRVFSLLFLEAIDLPAAQRLAVVRLYHDALARWGPRILRWGAAVVWFVLSVNLLGLGQWLAAGIAAVSGFHIAGGGAGITLGGVLGFFVILLFGYTLSSGIRFLLREELLNRLHLARGVPELIASTLHYLLLLLVFFFAVNAGGVELNKFTVLTGALGVGVGFGLQNIVNNFISGLILQFERPIHIGDMLDIDGANGIVTRIGIRSSTVKTFQGAELIIPNANFISGKVTNWTLTNPQRRVELPVGVAYGSDLKLVASLLDRAARENENVLTSPAPAVFFMEFADSSINFELRFWVMQADTTVTIKSEVALAAWELLTEAGVEIPFPQRDLRLRAVDPEAAARLTGNGAREPYASAEAESVTPDLILGRAKRSGAGE
jgi:potassium efflux system protein